MLTSSRVLTSPATAHRAAVRANRLGILFAMLTAAAPASAQQSNPSPFVTPFTMVFASGGTSHLDASRLNLRFSRPDLAAGATGFDAIADHGYTVGIGAYTPWQRMLFGAEWSAADFGSESSTSGKTNAMKTTAGMATLGYAMASGWNFTFYPYIGLGTGKVTLTLQNRAGGATVSLAQDPTFDEIVLSPGRESKMIGSFFFVQPGFGFDYLMLSGPESHRGFSMGLRFATSITPHRTTWQYQGHEVFGAPDAAPTGTTVRLVFGVGGFKTASK